MNYKKLYNEIWDKRSINDEYAICAQTGKRIYKCDLTVWNFSHIKSKGSHPELKYDPDNVEIVSAGFHGSEHASGEFHNYLGL